MGKDTYYITTPIYYPSDKLHIGHAYCTTLTDAYARYKRLQGYDVMFLTGTDEHGQKIEERARERGVTPQAFVDNIVTGERGILDLWRLMNISYDRFIRTTDSYHVESIQKIFRRMYEKGDIYKGEYSGMYCTPCESFWTEAQLADGKCPDCGREVKAASEEAYFFRLSKYAGRVRELLTAGEFLKPASRVNEMVKNFIDPGLEDLCVSRTSFTWGVPVDFDPGHVVYVWVDALFNYVTALGFLNGEYRDYDKYWPADIHFVGKEIVRFHSIIWPAMLMSMELPLPGGVFGHGWLNFGGEKMSKSRGNVVDPYLLAQRYGVDALRFFLLRDVPFGSDGNFTNEALFSRVNSDLANDLGNLLSRTTAMAERYFGGILPSEREGSDADDELINAATALREIYRREMDAYAPEKALAAVMRVVSRANKYIDETTPWILARDPGCAPRLAAVLYNLLECLRIAAVLLKPAIPHSAERILKSIGADDDCATWESAARFGALRTGVLITSSAALFPRIDVEAELAALAAQDASPQPAPEAETETRHLPEISYDDFAKCEIRVLRVVACEKVEKADKLLKLTLTDGERERTVLSGIARWYAPADLVGRKLMAIVNLAPRKIRGFMSEGMILCPDADGRAVVVFADDSVPEGARVL